MASLSRTLVAAAILLAFSAQSLAQSPTRRIVTDEERAAAVAAVDRFISPTLTRFGSDAQFRQYVEAVRRLHRIRYDYYYSSSSQGHSVQFAQAQNAAPLQSPVQTDVVEPPLCDPELGPCPQQGEPDPAAGSIYVTGSRASPRNPSITNNQMRNVEEGDIVKQIDHYLLVLQDGRIFVVDTRSGGRQLTLTDRIDVYRDPESDMWYDEMLVFGDRVLITGYSYDDGVTEMAVFQLDGRGRLSRQGVFRISSNDYYSSRNYATRIVDGSLVTYTPIDVDDVGRPQFRWPVIRRWRPEDDQGETASSEGPGSEPSQAAEGDPETGSPLLEAANIYRPVRRFDGPTIHTVSVCPLEPLADGGDLDCRTTAFVGPERAEWYVTENDVFLWTASDEAGEEECPEKMPLTVADSMDALL